MTANALQGVVTMWDNGNTIGMLVCMIFYAGTTVLALYLWEKEKARSRRWKRSYKNIAHLYLSETDKLRDEAERERESRLAAEGESTEWEIHYHELEQKCKAMQEDREVRWVWDPQRAFWLPSNLPIRNLATKVPFPIVPIKQDDTED